MAPSWDDAFNEIAAGAAQDALDKSYSASVAAGRRHGLVEQGDGKPSQKHVWERSEGNHTLRFTWRWYDQSGPFSMQPDMNILLVQLFEADKLMRSVEERYED